MLNKENLVGKNLCQDKKYYETGGIFYGLFWAPKIKYSLTINKYGIIQQHMIFEGFNDSKRILHRSQYFRRLKGKKLSAMLPKAWNKSFKDWL